MQTEWGLGWAWTSPLFHKGMNTFQTDFFSIVYGEEFIFTDASPGLAWCSSSSFGPSTFSPSENLRTPRLKVNKYCVPPRVNTNVRQLPLLYTTRPASFVPTLLSTDEDASVRTKVLASKFMVVHMAACWQAWKWPYSKSNFKWRYDLCKSDPFR